MILKNGNEQMTVLDGADVEEKAEEEADCECGNPANHNNGDIDNCSEGLAIKHNL